tara:strand:- start:1701 stop:2012 length:312 start_codon:yes stop_codon:yes gene_type:complete
MLKNPKHYDYKVYSNSLDIMEQYELAEEDISCVMQATDLKMSATDTELVVQKLPHTGTFLILQGSDYWVSSFVELDGTCWLPNEYSDELPKIEPLRTTFYFPE